VDAWTVARGQLGEGGSRWLPVRNPALYAAQAFGALLRGAGVAAGGAGVTDRAEGAEVAAVESAPLAEIAREMLLYSTNLTAEVLGLAASRARGLSPATLAESADAMSRFMAKATGARVRLVDHSGLGDGSRVAATEMALALASQGTMERLRPLLRGIALTDPAGEPLADPPGSVRAKTGSLNFVSTLAGYVAARDGTDLAFAIFAADSERRAGTEGDEAPPGGREFNARARRLQQVVLQRWAQTVW
jgi:D-alanyl-D-alanine carboxypeptidase/D-alanyl-D-alanine-endopeptidase (penicillin-binding protein 4)